MGEVYKARDTRLERTVAVKVLPSHMSSSAEVRQRFEREAKTISQLSHPHICALYDVGTEGETEYLVMELLEGETLTDRLAKGALPLDQTLRYGMEIADALDKAHRQGIVHRDLKPGNVMLTKSGVKLLDFGLAKAMAAPNPKGSLTALPTQQGLTQEGTILGTFQYMAPEQLEGKDADARTDIFALGATLYEMMTGRKAFSGTSQASLISAIMQNDPPAISTIQPTSPPALDRLIRTCLAKDPDERWQSAADIKRELRWLGDGSQAGAVTASRAARGSWLPWTIAAVAVVLAVGLSVRSLRSAPVAAGRMQVSIVPPEHAVLTEFFDLSSDGRKLAFVGIAGGKSLVRIRELGSDEVRALAGTDSAETVFWSPDGQSIGFVARGKLKRIELSTGSVEILADAELGRGGCWWPKGDILFAQKGAGAIYRVPASGGSVVPVTTLEKGDLMHRWPQCLPDGKRFLFYVKTRNPETSGTYLASIDKSGRKLVLRNGATGVFLPPATLLYCRNSALLAQPFDAERSELQGQPVTVTRPVLRGDVGSYRDLFTVSDSGILAFRAGSAQKQATWMDRRGNPIGRIGSPGEILSVSLSPDDRIAGLSFLSLETGIRAISMVDLDRDTVAPFAEPAALPVWSPDGGTIFYRQERERFEIRRKSVRSGPGEEAIEVVDAFATPHSVSPDGRYLLYTRVGRNFDIGVKDLHGKGGPQILLATEFGEQTPHFSPDGRWFAYSSDENGQAEIFVRRFPMTDEKWRISTSGGQQPLWSRNGKEIFFVALDGNFMTAAVSAGSTFSAGAPQPLFRTSVKLNAVSRQFAASADGQRFLMVVPTDDFDSQVFRVLLNWQTSR